jgi:hypothetical protein
MPGVLRSLSAGAWRTCAAGMTVFGLVIVALVGCGGDSESETRNESLPEEPARLGCGEYCQQAGGFGGGSTAKDMLTIDTTSPVEALADGTVPITMTCRFTTTCEGAFLLVPDDFEVPAGRSDLLVEADSSRTIAVPLSDVQRETLRSAGRIKVTATADLFPSLETLPVGERDEWNGVIPEVMEISAAGS